MFEPKLKETIFVNPDGEKKTLQKIFQLETDLFPCLVDMKFKGVRVDVEKAKQLGYHAQMINSGRFINDSMGGYVAKQIVKKLVKAEKQIQNSKILIMGITFKEDVSDIRNSKVVDVYRELLSYGVKVDVVDPYADPEEVKEEYKFDLAKETAKDYDVIIVAVSHDKYIDLDEKYFKSITSENAIFVDIKGMYRNKIKELNYWSL